MFIHSYIVLNTNPQFQRQLPTTITLGGESEEKMETGIKNKAHLESMYSVAEILAITEMAALARSRTLRSFTVGLGHTYCKFSPANHQQ